MIDKLEISKCYNDDGSEYWTVSNVNGEYENHTHFTEYKGAKMLKKIVERKEIPINPYFKQSALRVSIDLSYKNLIKKG